MIPTQNRSCETFEQKMRATKAKNTLIVINTVLNNFEKFSEDHFEQKDIIPDLKVVPEETLWDTLQEWISYTFCKKIQWASTLSAAFIWHKNTLNHKMKRVF